jgi:hypothetical protein
MQSNEIDEHVTKVIKEEQRKWIKRLQAGNWLMGSQMECGHLELFQGISKFFMETLFRIASHYGMPNAKEMREIQRVQARANALATTAIQVRVLDACIPPNPDMPQDEWKQKFGHLQAPLLNKKFDQAAFLRAVQPICYVGIEEAAFACTWAKDMFESRVTEEVLKAMQSLIEDRRPRYVAGNDGREVKGNEGGRLRPLSDYQAGRAAVAEETDEEQQQRQREQEEKDPIVAAANRYVKQLGDEKKIRKDDRLTEEEKTRRIVEIQNAKRMQDEYYNLCSILHDLKQKRSQNQLSNPEPGSAQAEHNQSVLNFTPSEEDKNPYYTIDLTHAPIARAGSLPPSPGEMARYVYNEIRDRMKKHKGNAPDVITLLLAWHDRSIDGVNGGSNKLLVFDNRKVFIAKSLFQGALTSSLMRLCVKIALSLGCMPKRDAYLLGTTLAKSPWMYETFCNDESKMDPRSHEPLIFKLLKREAEKFMTQDKNGKFHVLYNRGGQYEQALMHVLKTFKGGTQEELDKQLNAWMEQDRAQYENESVLMDRDVERWMLEQWYERRGTKKSQVSEFWPKDVGGPLQHKYLMAASAHLPKYPDSYLSQNEGEYKRMLNEQVRRDPDKYKASKMRFDPGIHEQIQGMFGEDDDHNSSNSMDESSDERKQPEPERKRPSQQRPAPPAAVFIPANIPGLGLMPAVAEKKVEQEQKEVKQLQVQEEDEDRMNDDEAVASQLLEEEKKEEEKKKQQPKPKKGTITSFFAGLEKQKKRKQDTKEDDDVVIQEQPPKKKQKKTADTPAAADGEEEADEEEDEKPYAASEMGLPGGDDDDEEEDTRGKKKTKNKHIEKKIAAYVEETKGLDDAGLKKRAVDKMLKDPKNKGKTRQELETKYDQDNQLDEEDEDEEDEESDTSDHDMEVSEEDEDALAAEEADLFNEDGTLKPDELLPDDDEGEGAEESGDDEYVDGEAAEEEGDEEGDEAKEAEEEA